MRKVIALFAVAALLSGCRNSPVSVNQTNNNGVPIELLFEHDGCKVYRFYDAGYKYYTDCRGSIEWSEKEGKNTVQRSNQTSN